jgi:hypothetical protein
MIMPKRAISLTLEESNLLWLRGITNRSGGRSLSETVDQLVTAARTQGAPVAITSVVGTIDLPEDDPQLEGARSYVRDLVSQSLGRPFLVRERKPTFSPKRSRRG